MTTLLLAAALASIGPLDPALLAGETWNQFRGPRGAGIAPEGARLPDELDVEANLLWSAAIDPGLSSPCLSDERVFVTGHSENELATLCLDRDDGRLLWRRALEVETLERTHEINGPASPTPVTDGERVVAYFGSFGLVAYDAAGEELWRRPLARPENTFGTAASPILFEGSVIFVSDANEGSYLEALDPATGATRWKKERAGFVSGWSTPALWPREGRTELLVLGAGGLTGYDAADGKALWSVPGLTDEPITTPVVGEGLVFATSYNMKIDPDVIGLPTFEAMLEKHDKDGDGQLDAAEAAENASVLSRPDADGEGDHPLKIFFRFLDVDRDGEITGEEWKKLVAWVDGFAHLNGFFAIRPGDGERPAEIAWQYPRGVPECPSPLFYRGRLWAVTNGGVATCLDAKTGRLVFQERLGPRGPYYASLVAGDGKLYAGSARGEIAVFAAADELSVLSRSELGERLMATPALSDGAIYVRTEATLRAFGTQAD